MPDMHKETKQNTKVNPKNIITRTMKQTEMNETIKLEVFHVSTWQEQSLRHGISNPAREMRFLETIPEEESVESYDPKPNK